MRELLIDKLCNALLPDAASSGLLPAMVAGTVEAARKHLGGLWVGGRVKASSEAITFTPNSMNAAIHTKLDAVRIPLSSVRTVRREFGWLTGIVVVEHAQGEFRFRCFGARNVARVLSSHVPGT
jgi:hypothetical protein